MNAMVINAEVPEEIIESFLGRMSAPQKDSDVVLGHGMGKKWAILGLVIGLCMGLVFYLIVDTNDSNKVKYVVQTESANVSGSQLSLVKKTSIIPEQILQKLSDEKSLPEVTSEHKPEHKSKHRESKVSLVEPKKKRKIKHVHTRVPKKLLRRGWRLYSQGNYQSAAVAFGRAVHSSPRHTGGYYGLALCLFEQGKEDIALRVLEKGSKKVGPKAGLWVLAGSIYQWMGKERMARIAYHRYLKNNPHGAYARDVRVILSRKHLPKLLPFDDDLPDELQSH